MKKIEAKATKQVVRPLAILVLALVVLSTLAPNSVAEAKRGENRIGVFGTVIHAPENGTVGMITRKGALTLTIAKKTKIVTKRNGLELDEVSPGDSVTGYYVEEDGLSVAKKLTFLADENPITIEHIIGVVIDSTDDTVTVQTNDGDEVEIPTPDTPEGENLQEGSLVVTAVEENSETGELDVKALATAASTVEKLNDAIGNEITLAQQKLLKIRMSETASAHLTRLYATLDEIKRESQAKINAAFAEFEQNYKKSFDPADLESLRVVIEGRVLTKTEDQLVVAAHGNGRRSYIVIPDGVEVQLVDGTQGTYLDVQPDMYVEVSAIPQTTTSSPIARLIKIVPTPDKNDGNKGPKDEKITGKIIVVDNPGQGSGKVIVVGNPNGSDEAAVITDETAITGVDTLEEGQKVEVTLGDDGISADEVEVITDPADNPVGIDETTPVATPAPPVEYSLIGKIREISTTGVILDDVYLTLDTSSPTADPLTVGEQIEFTVIVDDNGNWVVVGVEQ
jgi:hypothetical protein